SADDQQCTDVRPLSLHDALPILPFRWTRYEVERWSTSMTGLASGDMSEAQREAALSGDEQTEAEHAGHDGPEGGLGDERRAGNRSEEHTSELQSRENLVCRLLLE